MCLFISKFLKSLNLPPIEMNEEYIIVYPSIYNYENSMYNYFDKFKNDKKIKKIIVVGNTTVDPGSHSLVYWSCKF